MRTLRVGSLLGIPLLVNPGWFLIAGLTVWLLATRIFPEILPELSTSMHIVMAVCSALLFFASIILHELAHSVVAKLYGIPVRSITLFLFGGVAHITREATRPLNELLMAAAGPLLSLALGGLLIGGWYLFGAVTDEPLPIIIFWSGAMNIILGIFNLLPAFPMDGGRVFRSLVWLVTGDFQRSTVIAAWTGRAFAWSMMGMGALAIAGLSIPVVATTPISGLWLILIGFFLENGARQSLVQVRLIRELQRFTARDLMLSDPPVADAGRSIGSLARGVIELNPRVAYFVEENGSLAGILSSFELLEIPERMWDTITAGEAMVPRAKLVAMKPDAPLSEVLMEMENEDLLHAPVVEEGRVIGIIPRERIVNVLRQAGLISV